MTRLVVCDSHDASWIGEAGEGAAAGDQWHVLVIGVSHVRYRAMFSVELAALGAVSVLDVASIAPDVHECVSRYVVALVHDLPGRDLGGATIGEMLASGEENLWWSLVISEKSSFRGRLIERLFRLALIDAVVARERYSDVWIRTSDPLLAAAVGSGRGVPPVEAVILAARPSLRVRLASRFILAYWLRALAAAARVLVIRAIAFAARWPVVSPPRAGLALFTMYPYWWLRANTPSAADRFFSAPPESRRPYYVAWMTWPLRLWRDRAAVRRVIGERRIVPLQTRLRIADALAVLSPRRFAALARVDAALALIREQFLRFDVSAMVREELRASLSNAELMMDQLITRAMARVVVEEDPAVVAYRCENQPWEAALVRAAGSRTVGFFHSPFGPNYAALRFAPGDFTAGPPRGAGSRPAPGGMLVCGDAARDYLTRDRYPVDRVAPCGPQRHASFVRFLVSHADRLELRKRLQLPPAVPVYFIAIAIVEVETEGLFACIEEALQGAEPVHLVVKTHPNRPAGDAAMRRALGAAAVRSSIVPVDADMYEYLAASDAMITIGSTVAFEAMALGVMPIVYEHPGTYAVTSLRAFDSALFVVNSPESMRVAIDAVARDGSEAQRRRAGWPAAIRRTLGDLATPLDSQMDQALDRLGYRDTSRSINA